MARAMDSEIPILDFSQYSLSVNRNGVVADVLKLLGSKLVQAFETVGFCYIINHGIPDDFIQNYFSCNRSFFELPADEKQKWAHSGKDSLFGWIGIAQESLDVDKPGDLKETFDYFKPDDSGKWPVCVPEMQDVNRKLFDYCMELGHRICDVLSIGLGLDRLFLTDAHSLMGQKGNATTLRTLYYPPIDQGVDVKAGQERLGEHSDFGTLTILFQDDVGGLEVKIPDKGFVPANPIPGAVLVNIGDMMQRWTSDRLLATRHRVRIPEMEVKRRKHRQSIVFFMDPNDDVIIRCLDGSNTYEPVGSLEYLFKKLRETYQ